MTATPASRRDDSLRGILFMAMGMFLFSAVDTAAKFLTQDLHPLQIVWTRQIGLFAGVVVLLAVRGRVILQTRNRGMQITRGLVAAGSATCFITAISFVPLADAMAVSFVAPFMVTLLGAIVLKEAVGVRRWVAVLIGFAGAMVIIRPGFGVMHPGIFLVILAALLFAIRQIISRYVAGADPVTTTVAYTSIASSAALTLVLPFVWQWPEPGLTIWLMAFVALTAAVAEIMVIKALEVAQAVVVAPVQYSILIWGTLYGWMVFGDLPDGWTWIGAAIIIATGVYTLNRERIAARRGRA